VPAYPSLKQFRAAARREFSFLVSEFRFVEERLPIDPKKNPFKVAYTSDTTRVTVQGINWGANVQVMLFAVTPTLNLPARVPLWAVIDVRAPNECDLPAGQIAQLSHNATMLRRYASEVLRGDFSIFPAAQRVVDGNAARLAAKYKVPKLP
jgi:hypothetical protein